MDTFKVFVIDLNKERYTVECEASTSAKALLGGMAQLSGLKYSVRLRPANNTVSEAVDNATLNALILEPNDTLELVPDISGG